MVPPKGALPYCFAIVLFLRFKNLVKFFPAADGPLVVVNEGKIRVGRDAKG